MIDGPAATIRERSRAVRPPWYEFGPQGSRPCSSALTTSRWRPAATTGEQFVNRSGLFVDGLGGLRLLRVPCRRCEGALRVELTTSAPSACPR